MEIDNLRESLSQYESQLSQVNLALSVTHEGEEYESLSSLRSDLTELIDLTNENIKQLSCESLKPKPNHNIPEKINNLNNDEQLDDEYALFMAEMSKSGAYDKNEQDANDQSEIPDAANVGISDIEEELSSLEGMRCAVLFCHKLGGTPSLYNAMVSSVIRDNINSGVDFHNIQVRVMFTNPTHLEMVPCPFYLDGECKFSDDLCRFSHGEVVALSTLKEAIEPEFSSLKGGSRVLAKIKQDEEPTSSKLSEKFLLWHRAIVISVVYEDHVCNVRLEHDVLSKGSSKNDYEVDFGYIFPLSDDYSDSESDSDSSTDMSYQPVCINDDVSKDDLVEKSLSINPGSVKLGDWEKHTKGIGSKIMMKMGYVTGTGLGPQSDGIIQPIPCRITPTGRSLDHCMDLREMTDLEDPVKAEKKLRRLKKKKEEREKKAYERSKERQQNNVFNFLNKTLSVKSHSAEQNDGDTNIKNKLPQAVKDIKTSSCKNLNIEQFKLSEDVKKIEKDIAKLKSSLLRNSADSDVKRGISVQLNSKLNDLNNLKIKQAKISNEQVARKDKKKMTIF